MVSVIIPIYNIKDMLEKCVASVVRQTYSDLEILLVDDGSTDGSGQLCERLAASDERIKPLHKENGGLSDARNYGLSHATGDYIIYLDGDDWMADHAIQQLIDTAVNYDADIVQSCYYYAYEEYLLTRIKTYPLKKFTKEEALHELLSNGVIKNFAWGNLLKKELAEKVSFVKGKYFEDIYWKYQIIDLCHNFVYLAEPLFYYRQRNCSISSAFSIRNLHLLEGGELRLDFIKSHYPDLFDLGLRQHWLQAFRFMRSSEHSEKEVSDCFKKYFDRLNLKYYYNLKKALRGDPYIMRVYSIYNNCYFLYPLFDLIDRIRGRFGTKIYRTIEY